MGRLILDSPFPGFGPAMGMNGAYLSGTMKPFRHRLRRSDLPDGVLPVIGSEAVASASRPIRTIIGGEDIELFPGSTSAND